MPLCNLNDEMSILIIRQRANPVSLSRVAHLHSYFLTAFCRIYIARHGNYDNHCVWAYFPSAVRDRRASERVDLPDLFDDTMICGKGEPISM